MREIAKGRVWTGEQALSLHLVDKIGGFYDAVDQAKALAKIDKSADVRLVDYPNTKSFFGNTRQSVRMSLSGLKALSFIGWAMSDPKAQSMMTQMSDERLREQGANVMAPEPYQPSTR